MFCVRGILQSRIPVGMAGDGAPAAGPRGHSVLSRRDLGCWEWEDPEVLRAQGAQPQPCSLAELPLCTSRAPDPSLNQQQQNSCKKKLPVGSPEQENPNSQEEFSECSLRTLPAFSDQTHSTAEDVSMSFSLPSHWKKTGKRQE